MSFFHHHFSGCQLMTFSTHPSCIVMITKTIAIIVNKRQTTKASVSKSFRKRDFDFVYILVVLHLKRLDEVSKRIPIQRLKSQIVPWNKTLSKYINAIESTSNKWDGYKGTSHYYILFHLRISFYLIIINVKKPSNREVSINVLNAMRLRYNGRSSMQQTELETAQYSMELMRQNVQQLFDKEIQTVVRKYIEVSFRDWRVHCSMAIKFKRKNYWNLTDLFWTSIEKCKRKPQKCRNHWLLRKYACPWFMYYICIEHLMSSLFIAVAKSELWFIGKCQTKLLSAWWGENWGENRTEINSWNIGPEHKSNWNYFSWWAFICLQNSKLSRKIIKMRNPKLKDIFFL